MRSCARSDPPKSREAKADASSEAASPAGYPADSNAGRSACDNARCYYSSWCLATACPTRFCCGAAEQAPEDWCLPASRLPGAAKAVAATIQLASSNSDAAVNCETWIYLQPSETHTTGCCCSRPRLCKWSSCNAEAFGSQAARGPYLD